MEKEIKLTMGKLLDMEEKYQINVFDPSFFSSLSLIEEKRNTFIKERVEPFNKAVKNKNLNKEELAKQQELLFKLTQFQSQIKFAQSQIYYKIYTAYYDKDFSKDPDIDFPELEEWYNNFLLQAVGKFQIKNTKDDTTDMGK